MTVMTRPRALVAAFFICTSCGGAAPDYDRPEASKDIISNKQLFELEELGLAIHEGQAPPDITGTYEWDSNVRVVDPRPEREGQPICDGQITFTVASDDTITSEILYTGFDCEGEGGNSGIIISGADDCFTLYASGDETFLDCESRDLIRVTSGCLSDDGIEGYQLAAAIGSYTSDECDALLDSGRVPPAKEFVMDEETDGLAAVVSE